MNKKVQYLVEGITKDIIAYLMQDNNMDLLSAVNLFHNFILRVPPLFMKYLSLKLRWGKYYKL